MPLFAVETCLIFFFANTFGYIAAVIFIENNVYYNRETNDCIKEKEATFISFILIIGIDGNVQMYWKVNF